MRTTALQCLALFYKPGISSAVADVQTSFHNGGCYLWPHPPKHCSGHQLGLQLTDKPSQSRLLFSTTLFPQLKTTHHPLPDPSPPPASGRTRGPAPATKQPVLYCTLFLLYFSPNPLLSSSLLNPRLFLFFTTPTDPSFVLINLIL